MTNKVAIRRVEHLIFECPSPSVWNLVGAPVTLAFNGKRWVLSRVLNTGKVGVTEWLSRKTAIDVVLGIYNLTPQSSDNRRM